MVSSLKRSSSNGRTMCGWSRPPPIHTPPAREFIIMRLLFSVRPRCVSGLFIRAVVIILAALSLQTSANAQGTSGSLPDPINARDITGYAERLQLSAQQRQAVDSFHEQYKREFRALREGEIADFLKSMRDLNGTGMMPKRDVVEKFL